MDTDDKGNGHYLVLNLLSGECWTFDTPHEVAVFMWGRDFEEYAIYKRFPWASGDLATFEGALSNA